MLSDAGKSIAVSSVPALLEHAASTFPDHTRWIFFGRKLTYTELARQVDRAARGFQRLGVAHGMRVGLCLPNTPYFVIAYFAVLKAGGIVVNFNPLQGPSARLHARSRIPARRSWSRSMWRKSIPRSPRLGDDLA